MAAEHGRFGCKFVISSQPIRTMIRYAVTEVHLHGWKCRNFRHSWRFAGHVSPEVPAEIPCICPDSHVWFVRFLHKKFKITSFHSVLNMYFFSSKIWISFTHLACIRTDIQEKAAYSVQCMVHFSLCGCQWFLPDKPVAFSYRAPDTHHVIQHSVSLDLFFRSSVFRFFYPLTKQTKKCPEMSLLRAHV